MYIALLGDSTLDNAAYTDGGPAVVDVLKDRLPAGASVSLLAVDGARMDDIPNQLALLPPGVTHLALSVGGNDAALAIGVLDRPVDTVAGGLRLLHREAAAFATRYRSTLSRVVATGCKTLACTIYNGNFRGEGRQDVISSALQLWNDAILQAALSEGCPVLDLRRVCSAPAHFTRQIEPNEAGGRRIASALCDALTSDLPSGSRVMPGPAAHS